MTRQCADCKIIMGEKCPECGSEKLLLIDSAEVPDVEVPDWWECTKCDHIFQEGMTLDPPQITHGICDPCLEKRRQELHSVAKY
ncbi:hypothetical protein LCGC14_1903000 [marine sediment metagenome]|uniref:Uncharacterized protein n=1 Tax=marine sediment metagenome TaxID=412755 RepID=A0A0F9I9X6_9ZZZZ